VSIISATQASQVVPSSIANIMLDESKLFYPGRPGILHNPDNTAFDEFSDHWKLLGELSLPQLQRLSFMFNYQRESSLLGTKRVCIQLNDSEWSSSFSLDTMEIVQSLCLDHPSGALEVGFTVVSAPGRLGKYTKIIRFKPKFAVLNKLDMDLQLIQPEAFTNVLHFVGSVPANRVLPFHLTNPYADRKLTIRMQGTAEISWQDSVAFDVDQLGSYTMQINRRVQLRSTDYISTRENKIFTVTVPQTREFGLYFETDWDAKNIVVKGYKPGSIAYLDTDIQIGDVLIAIDGESIVGVSFEDVMTNLKTKVHNYGCSLTFGTVEEKLRQVLSTASNAPATDFSPRRGSVLVLQSRQVPEPDNMSPVDSRRLKTFQTVAEAHAMTYSEARHNPEFDIEKSLSYNFSFDSIPLRVELRQFESTSVMVIHKADTKACSEYRIFNYSVSHVIYYKQKGLQGNRWAALGPGQNVRYIWEDPFDVHRLMLRAGENVLCPSVDTEHKRNLKQTISDLGDTFIANPLRRLAWNESDSKTTVVGLDEIGYKGKLPLSYSKGELNIRIESEGPSKQLYIFPDDKYDPVFGEVFAKKQVEKLGELKSMLSLLAEDPTAHSIIFERTSESISNKAGESVKAADAQSGKRWGHGKKSSRADAAGGLPNKIHSAKSFFVKSLGDEKEKVCRTLQQSSLQEKVQLQEQLQEQQAQVRPRAVTEADGLLSGATEAPEIVVPASTRLGHSQSEAPRRISDEPESNSSTNTANNVKGTDMEEFSTTSALAKFDSILGDDDIPNKNMLMVHVLEARDLISFVTGKFESVFCTVKMKRSNLTK
jgi:hypothetical protein